MDITIKPDFVNALVDLLEALIARDFTARGACDDSIEERSFEATDRVLEKVRTDPEFSKFATPKLLETNAERAADASATLQLFNES